VKRLGSTFFCFGEPLVRCHQYKSAGAVNPSAPYLAGVLPFLWLHESLSKIRRVLGAWLSPSAEWWCSALSGRPCPL